MTTTLLSRPLTRLPGLGRRALTIPVNHVTRGAIFRVKDEPVAEKADALAASLSKKIAASVGTGYEGYTRLVCKGAFDYKVYYEFSPDAFGRFKAGPGLTTFEETVKEFSKLSVDGKVHTQNFVIEGFGKKK